MTTHAELVAQEEAQALEDEKYVPAIEKEVVLIEALRGINDEMSKLEKRKKALVEILKQSHLERGIKGVVFDGKILSELTTYTTQTTDTKGLMKDYPEIAAQYVSTKEVKRFSVK